MSISSIGINAYQNANGLTYPVATVVNAGGSTGTSQAVANAATNNSSLSVAISQALMQMNNGAGLSSLLTPASTQSSSNFMNSLLASMQGSSSSNPSSTNSLPGLFGYSSGQAAKPVKLDQSSSTIKLQTSIQNLIAQLDGSGGGSSSLLGGSPDSNTPSGLENLQQSFNNLVTASGGNPSQASLQTFLKTVAINIQGTMSMGSLFDASA